ncbi:HvfC family RiPP maturation protein [Rheinheimera sp. WS51]|uniref:HvfC family RiPP maturation protein n=1 Tax=Rheinheimera sp. WS51 TaxID=3425886 RepID=UPI003D927B31
MMKFQQIQQQFMAHIQNPEQQPGLAQIEVRRLAIYRNLFFNNVLSFVSSAYPVLCSLYTEDVWRKIVRQFFANYSCSSPYFLHVSEHFLQFLQQQYQRTESDPIFMLELAHYEWTELYLSTKCQQKKAENLTAEQVLASPLQLSELSLLVSYPFPVHLISKQQQPLAATENQFYLLYRDNNDEVKFVLINQLTALLLQLIQQNSGATADKLLLELTERVPQISPQQLEQGAVKILQQFAAKGVIQAFQMD